MRAEKPHRKAPSRATARQDGAELYKKVERSDRMGRLSSCILSKTASKSARRQFLFGGQDAFRNRPLSRVPVERVWFAFRQELYFPFGDQSFRADGAFLVAERPNQTFLPGDPIHLPVIVGSDAVDALQMTSAQAMKPPSA